MDAYAKIREMRRYLHPKGVPVLELSHFFGRIHVNKNRYQFNNADEAKKWKPVTQRVRSVVSRSGFTLHCAGAKCPNSSHRKPSTGNKLSQNCEVLGPYYCSDCTKEAHRNRYNLVISETFPSVAVNERRLCKQFADHSLSLTSVSLPALTSDVTKVSTWSDTSAGALTRDQGYMTTTTELQKRVMARHKQRKLGVFISESSPNLTKEFRQSKKRTRFLELPDVRD